MASTAEPVVEGDGAGGGAGAGADGPAAPATHPNVKQTTDPVGPPVGKSNLPRVLFGSVHERNVGTVRTLNEVVLPVRYNDKFYADLCKTPPEFTKIAYYNDVFVGSIGGRVEATEDAAVSKLYIMTLCVLDAYRGLGIGSSLLKSLVKAAQAKPELGFIYLHVHTANEKALKFYDGFNFKIHKTIKGYYKRVTPPDCHVLRLDLHQEEGDKENEAAATETA